MDFLDKELRLILQSLYRYRGQVSGASQEERNKLLEVEGIITKIEGVTGRLTVEKTSFDREMESSLSVTKKGKDGKKK